MANPRSPFLGKGSMHPFIHLSIGFWLYTALQCRSSMSSNCLVFHTSGGISSSPAAFLFLIFLRTESSSSCVNGPSLMSNCLLIILVIFMSNCLLIILVICLMSNCLLIILVINRTNIQNIRVIQQLRISFPYCQGTWRLSVFVARHTKSVAQGLFLGGSGRRDVAQTHPAAPKMPQARRETSPLQGGLEPRRTPPEAQGYRLRRTSTDC